MFRLIFGILSILPWWAYLAASLFLGGTAFTVWQETEIRAADAEAEILGGPPTPLKVGDYFGYAQNSPFEEVRLAGVIRADLGVGQVEGTVPKTYVVLDSADRDGPLVAVMFVGSDDQEGLNALISEANENGFVIAGGFARRLDWADVSGQLRVKGVRREVLLIEAMVNDRATELRDKAQKDLPVVFVMAGLAAAAALMAYLRFAKWRKRRGAYALRPTPAPVQASANPPALPAAQTGSPWGASAPPPSPSRPPAPPKRREPDPAEEQAAVEAPAFESVFPGGGSGFRFKTADEIIRETFGTVSRLDRPQE